jgi:RNA polymerase sigma-70 factor (ECF subfamily)
MSDRRSEFATHLMEVQSRLYGYIHSLVRDHDDADDLFQQTAAILWNKFTDYDPARSFFSWACGIARFEVSNFLRTRGRQKLYFTDDLNLLLIEAHEQFLHDEMEDRRAALGKCVQKLRDRDRELLRDCYGEMSGVNDVAGKQGRSSQSVYNSLRRIRRSLFECIERALAQQARPGVVS